MVIDPKTPKRSKKPLPPASDKRPVKAARNYQDLVRVRELLLQELIEDLGAQGQVATITREMLHLVEIRLQNTIKAGLSWEDIFDFLEE